MATFDVESAVTPTNIDAVPKLLSEVAAASQAFSTTGDDVVVARRELPRALGTPREIMI
ncbi:hypothetical protein ANO14919_028360 [Xylariales sp. No.14919]|nr:hypothetical protein ANO14919_028360 [Xylariales sp. No.14919]